MKYYLVSLKDNQQVIASDEEIDSNKMDDLVFADNVKVLPKVGHSTTNVE